jgi:uncharacterized membrane protein YhaH (DUF805 family)
MNWYLKVLQQYADFNGRARRKEYWMFVLFNLSFSTIALYLDNFLEITIDDYAYGPLYGLYVLVLLIPGLAVLVRRLHDIGKSGWMLLVAFIPFIGPFWFLILLVTEGNAVENQFGQDPIEETI